MPEKKDWDGFLPPHPCERCGKMLQGQGQDRPAELYAGTATGLCYECERSGPYEVPNSTRPTGARLVSHPPTCPSHRRDRHEYLAFADCEECKGLGAVNQRGAWNYNSWGPTRIWCPSCEKRWKEHPHTVEEHRQSEALRVKQAEWMSRMLAEWAVTWPRYFPEAKTDDDIPEAERLELAQVLKRKAPPRPMKWTDEFAFPEGWAVPAKPRRSRVK